jgi:hypothetical protein
LDLQAAGSIVAVVEFFTNPETTKPPKVKDLKGLVLTAEGDIFQPLMSTTNGLLWINHTAAIGSGSALCIRCYGYWMYS